MTCVRVLAWSTLIGGVACANVLGIHDAELDPTYTPTGGATTGAGPSNLCERYCGAVTTNCAGVFAVYASLDTCLAVCAHLPEGAPGDTTNDSIQCRLRQAEDALSEPSFYCPAAGPGGNGVCGANCDALCTLSAAVCQGAASPFTSDQDCRHDCAALRDLGTFSTDPSKEMYEGASVQCRLFHVSAAAARDARIHCTHVGGAPPCVADTTSTGTGT